MRIICTVTNDLSYDQRMKRICTSLANANHDVTLVGRKLNTSTPLAERPFAQKRLKNFFNKKVFFYAEHNIRLFFYLLFVPCDVICSIDLDSILAGYLAAKIRNKPLVYDAHEYFTEMEEIVARPKVHKVWSWLEKSIVPKVKYGYTVSEGYANMFHQKYGVDLKIVRNATVWKERNLSQERKYILYQGAVNVGRGLDTLISAMHQVNYPLVICGKGDVYQALIEQVKREKLEDKVTFEGYVAPEKLEQFTELAKVGITLFTNAGLSNQYSLANRFFDYMHNGVPQLAMAYPEYVNFNAKHEIAALVKHVEADEIAAALNRLIEDNSYWEKLHQNAIEASKTNSWQGEEARLLSVYEAVEEAMRAKR
tara:strand:- start:8237 stop:9337 length:1101 start_codon:yes stop_codon:yes gene_type:complete